MNSSYQFKKVSNSMKRLQRQITCSDHSSLPKIPFAIETKDKLQTS